MNEVTIRTTSVDIRIDDLEKLGRVYNARDNFRSLRCLPHVGIFKIIIGTDEEEN